MGINAKRTKQMWTKRHIWNEKRYEKTFNLRSLKNQLYNGDLK